MQNKLLLFADYNSSMLGLFFGLLMKLPSMYTSLNPSAMALSYTSKRFLRCSICDSKFVTSYTVVLVLGIPLAGKTQ